MICYFNASRRAGAPLCALAGARRRASPPPLRFEGPARPPLPCVRGCLKNTTLFARGCLIFVLWLYNASRRAGAPLCALAGARRRASPPPLRFEGPARPPLPCVLGCHIFVLWLLCPAPPRAGSLRLRCPRCARRRWRSPRRCPPRSRGQVRNVLNS